MRRRRIAGLWVAWWLALLLLYLLFVAKLTWQETVAGAVAAAITALAPVATAHAASLKYRPRTAWIRRFAGVPWRVLADCGIVFAALWNRLFHGQAVTGAFRVIPFDPGGDTPEAAARRALVTIGITVAPNTYLVGMDQEQGRILLHQLVPSRQPPGHGDRKWPL